MEGFGSSLKDGLVRATFRETPNINPLTTIEGSPALNRMKASAEMRSFLSEDLFQDPLFTRFKIFFNFSTTVGLLADPAYADTNSAYRYFERIGDKARMNLLAQFIEDLKTLSTEYSFLFDEITGLENLISADYADFCKKDVEINIRTKETLDMKIQGLIGNYRKLVWDWDRRVYVLPANLRRFGMHIYIYPMGIYRVNAKDILNSTTNKTIANLFPCFIEGSKTANYTLAAPSEHNHMLYRLDGCEFVLKKSGANFLSSVLNSQTNPTENLLSINPMKFTIEEDITNWWHTGSKNMKSFASLVVGSSERGLVDGLLDIAKEGILNIASPLTERAASVVNKFGKYMTEGGLKELGKDALMDAAQYISTNASNYVKTQINRLFYGNVYGFSFDTLMSSAGSVNGAINVARNSLGNNRNKGSNNASMVGQNIYPQEAKYQSSNPGTNNIYGEKYKSL